MDTHESIEQALHHLECARLGVASPEARGLLGSASQLVKVAQTILTNRALACPRCGAFASYTRGLLALCIECGYAWRVEGNGEQP